MNPRWLVAPVLALLVGCSGSPRVLRVEREHRAQRVHIPRGEREPVELDADAFAEALAELAPHVRSSPVPLQEARRLFWLPTRSEPYAHARGSLGLVSLGLDLGPLRADAAITREYGVWCERRVKRRDCLNLQEGGSTLGRDGAYALAMHFAMGRTSEETKGALGEMADPVAVQASIVSAMTMYLMLWVLPEPLSKGLAATLTVALIGYLGVDTVWNLFQGWLRLEEEVDGATTFEQVRAAGERFGKVMGRNVARIFVMLATAALGNTAAGVASKLPTLPGSAQAAMVAEAQGGFRLSVAAAVDTATVSAEGATLVLAPGALAMASQGTGNGGQSSDDTTVYVSLTPEAQTQYLGITNNLARRAAEQLREKGFRIVELMRGLSREEARAVEQALIELHGLQKNGGTLVSLAVRHGLVEIVAHSPIPPGLEAPSQLRRTGFVTREGKMVSWWLWDGTNETLLKRDPTPDERRISLAEMWNHEFLVMRLAEQWRPEHHPPPPRGETNGSNSAPAPKEEASPATSPSEQPSRVRHYLYLPSAKEGKAVAAELRRRGFTVKSRKGADGVNWLVLVEQDLAPGDEAGLAVQEELERLAEEYSGEYDGSETALPD